ncbi:MAG: DUF5652 family protein [bacterium]|nr:DUF5652 family protein [bacterium]
MIEEVATVSTELATEAATMFSQPGLWENEIFIQAIVIAVYVWTIVWKGLALWRASQLKQKIWFVIFMLPFNTAGILEIVYLLIVSNSTWQEEKITQDKKKITSKNSKKSK